jgi:hypothetical protein
MSHAALVDELANELDTWPGVHIERVAEGVAAVRYEQIELGVLDADSGIAELRFSVPEREALVEQGDAESVESVDSPPEPNVVRHAVHGPSDVSAVLELFDRRYRDVRGEDDSYSSQDPA